MKLDKELKNKIDSYFEKMSPDDLYNVLIQKYGFVDENDTLVQKNSVESPIVPILIQKSDFAFGNDKNTTIKLRQETTDNIPIIANRIEIGTNASSVLSSMFHHYKRNSDKINAMSMFQDVRNEYQASLNF